MRHRTSPSARLSVVALALGLLTALLAALPIALSPSGVSGAAASGAAASGAVAREKRGTVRYSRAEASSSCVRRGSPSSSW